MWGAAGTRSPASYSNCSVTELKGAFVLVSRTRYELRCDPDTFKVSIYKVFVLNIKSGKEAYKELQ